jgi:hypothetical protein
MSNNFFPESRAVYEIMWKIWYSQTGHRRRDNRAHTLCMPDNLGYKHTLRICNTYCFSTATVVRRKRLDVTFICKLPVLLTRQTNNVTVGYLEKGYHILLRISLFLTGFHFVLALHNL